MNRARLQTIARAVAVIALLSGCVLCAQEAADKTSASASDDTVYEPGTTGVSSPRVIYRVDPEYTDKARKKKLNGIVVLSVIVTPEGSARDVKIIKSLDGGLDKNAMAAVSKWKFEPSTKDGKPVAMHVAVEVRFRLY